MAHVQGLSVVAEGVETQEQLEKLVRTKCDYIQGYIISRPVSENEAICFLKSNYPAVLFCRFSCADESSDRAVDVLERRPV